MTNQDDLRFIVALKAATKSDSAAFRGNSMHFEIYSFMKFYNDYITFITIIKIAVAITPSYAYCYRSFVAAAAVSSRLEKQQL